MLIRGVRGREASDNVGRGEHQRAILATTQNCRTVGADLVRLPVAVKAAGIDPVPRTDADRLGRQF